MKVIYILLLVFCLCIVSAKYLPDESASTDSIRNVSSIKHEADSIVATQSSDYDENDGDDDNYGDADNDGGDDYNDDNDEDDNEEENDEDNDNDTNSLEHNIRREKEKLQRKFAEEQRILQRKREKEERKTKKRIEKKRRHSERLAHKIAENQRKIQENLEDKQKKLEEKLEEILKRRVKKIEEVNRVREEQLEEEERKKEEKQRKRQEKLEDEQKKREEKQKKREEKLEEENREREERIEEEERKKEEKQRQRQENLEELQRKREEKLEEEQRKREEQERKRIEKNNEELENKSTDLEIDQDLDLEDVWKNYVYEKYGITINSTDVEKKGAVLKYVTDQLGLNANTTRTEYHQAVLQLLVQNKMVVDAASQSSFQNYLVSHVNAAYIKKLQLELETKIAELNNDTALLANVNFPWAPAAQRANEEKKTILTTVVQYLTNVMPNWITGAKSTSNAQTVFNLTSNSTVDVSNVSSNNATITPGNSVTTYINRITVPDSTSAVVTSAPAGWSFPTNAQEVQLALNNVISHNAQDASASPNSVPIGFETLTGSLAVFSDAITSLASVQNSQTTEDAAISNFTTSSSSMGNNTSISTEVSVSTVSTSNIDGISAAPSSSSVSYKSNISLFELLKDVSISGPTPRIIINNTETRNPQDGNKIAIIGAEIVEQTSNSANIGVQSTKPEKSMPLNKNDVSSVSDSLASQAQVPSASFGNGAAVDSVSQSTNIVSNTGVYSVPQESVTLTPVGSGTPADSMSLNPASKTNAGVNTVSISTDGNYVNAAALDITTSSPDSTTVKSLNAISNRAEASITSRPVNASTLDYVSRVSESAVTALNRLLIFPIAGAAVASSHDVTSRNILETRNSTASTDIAPTTLTQNFTPTGFIPALNEIVSINSINNVVPANSESLFTITGSSTFVDTEATTENSVNAGISNSERTTSAPSVNNNYGSVITSVTSHDVVLSLTETTSTTNTAVNVIPTSNEGLISTLTSDASILVDSNFTKVEEVLKKSTVSNGTVSALVVTSTDKNVETVSTISFDVITVVQTNAANPEGIVISATKIAPNETASAIAENKTVPLINADWDVITSENILVTETETDNIATESYDVVTITDNNVALPDRIKTTSATSILTETLNIDIIPAETIVENVVGALAEKKVKNSVSTISSNVTAKTIVVADVGAAANEITNVVTGAPVGEVSTINETNTKGIEVPASGAVTSETVSDIVNIPTESNLASTIGAISSDAGIVVDINVSNNKATIMTEVVPSGLDVLASLIKPSIGVETGAGNAVNTFEVVSSTDLPVADVTQANTLVDALVPKSTTATGESLATISIIVPSSLAVTVGSLTERINTASTFASIDAITATAATAEVITKSEPSNVSVPSDISNVEVVGTTRSSFAKNEPTPNDKITHVTEIPAPVTDSAVLGTVNGLNKAFADEVNTDIFATTEASQTIQDVIFTPTIPVEVGASLLEVTQQ